MKFEIILQGDKKIIIAKEQADKLTAGILAKEDVFKVGLNVFKRSAIKGIFPLAEEIADNKEQWIKENREWNETCLRMSKYSINEKTEIELNNRILPAMKLAHIDLPIQLLEPMKANIRRFFEDNPKYPRCPMRIWWPFIRAKIAPLNKKSKKRANPIIWQAQWFKLIMRNDGAIAEWIKYYYGI